MLVIDYLIFFFKLPYPIPIPVPVPGTEAIPMHPRDYIVGLLFYLIIFKISLTVLV